MGMNRRSFIGTAAGSGALAALGPARFGFGESRGLFILVFLRGGCDGLHFVGPSAAREYVEARPSELRVLVRGIAADARSPIRSTTAPDFICIRMPAGSQSSIRRDPWQSSMLPV